MSKIKLNLNHLDGGFMPEYAVYLDLLSEVNETFDSGSNLGCGYSTAKYKAGARFTVTYWENQMVVADTHALLYVFSKKSDKVTVYASVPALVATLSALNPVFQTIDATDPNPNTVSLIAKLLLELASVAVSNKHAETAVLSNDSTWNTFPLERRSPVYVPGTEDVFKLVFTPNSIKVQRKPAGSAKYQAHVFVSRSANAGLHSPTMIHAVASKIKNKHAVRLALYGGGSFSQALFTPMADDCSNWRKERHPVTALVPHTMLPAQAAALANVVKRATTVKKT
jgi:hypothetical protein